jgi:aryl-alcohol dehydrogenase-like predicted oxidoreductase
MRYRKLGKTGFQVSEIGFGAWGIGGGWWAGENDEESLNALRLAFESGVNFVDTALNYGDGHSEALVGQGVRQWPSRVYVSTKVPPKNYTWPAVPGTPLAEAFPREWVVQCVEQSLKNLGLECVDLLMFHVWLDEWAGMDEWKETVEQLKRLGKISAVGLSLNFPLEGDYGARTIETGLIDACQAVYNIYEQTPQRGLFPLALEHGVGIIARSPLDEGALTGKITPETTFPEGSFLDSYFKADRKREVHQRAQALDFLLCDDCKTLGQAALRFCLSHPAVSTVIVGMRNPEHTRQNAEASDKGGLARADLDRLAEHDWPHNFWL